MINRLERAGIGPQRGTRSALLLLLAWGGSSCDAVQDQVAESKEAAAQKGVNAGGLIGPGFALSKNTEGVLYTWVDDSGEFQITQDPSEIAQAARKTVRVVVDGKSPGGADHVFVTDVSNLEGNFVVRKMARADWEKRGQAAREKRIAELRPAEPAPASALDGNVDAIIYGADWCKPCHLAEDYLKRKGARVVKKDIEEDEAAATEMRALLRGAGMSGSSIPVLNVGGTVLRGFSPSAIDAAWRKMKK